MTEKTNAELIAEAQTCVTDEYITPDTPFEEALIRRLAAALEAADRERDVLAAERDDLESRLADYLCDSTGGALSKTGYEVRTMIAHTEEYYAKLHAEDRAEVERERDALAAVAERAEDFVTRHYLDTRFGAEVLPILATAPADVLREHDAALIEGLADELDGREEEPSNPYSYDPWEDDSVDPTNLDEVVDAAVDEGWAMGEYCGRRDKVLAIREKARQKREEQS